MRFIGRCTPEKGVSSCESLDLPGGSSARPQTGFGLAQALVRREGESQRRVPAPAKPQSEPVQRLPAPLEDQELVPSARCIEAKRSMTSNAPGPSWLGFFSSGEPHLSPSQ